MNKNTPTYSQIISPELYNKIISKQHIYIADADQELVNLIKTTAAQLNHAEIIELGTGPGRFSEILTAHLPNLKVTSIDHDQNFIEFAQKLVSSKSFTFILDDITTYQHNKPVDIFFSMGVHHHIAKGEETDRYLKNIFNQLKKGGYYLIADEFLPDYKNDQDRELKLAIWYSHIIHNALKNNYHDLAVEEAKTLLDDINSGHSEYTFKSQKQIDMILEKAPKIDNAAQENQFNTAIKISNSLLNELEKSSLHSNSDPKLALSRKDYKVSRTILIQEAKKAGFNIENFIAIGPIDKIGAMGIFILKKD